MKQKVMETISGLSVTVQHKNKERQSALESPPKIIMKNLVVTLDTKTIEVKKLPIGKYAEMLKGITELPKHINTIEQLSSDQVIQQLPFLLSVCFPDIAKIIVIATDGQITEQEFALLGLNEVTQLILAIYEVNDYGQVFATIKKVLSRPKQPVPNSI